MAEIGAKSVADSDVIVDEMTDDDVTAYGTLRDSFLHALTTKTRSIERIRKASADDKTSLGGEVVYFIANEQGLIKIGTSANVEKRMDALQTSSPSKLTLMLTVPGGVELETLLHRRFKHLRESGEWFNGTKELKTFIEGAAFYKTRSV